MDKLHTFGFAATQIAADFTTAMARRLEAAVGAGFVSTPAPAYAIAGQKRSLMRD